MLGSVHRVLWATLLCWNKKSTWIHTGTGNKNTTTFTKYVFSCSYSYLMDSFFSFSYFSDKFKWLSALKSWTHSPTRIKDSSASFLRYIRISPSTLSHTGSSFFRSLFLSHHCYLGALHLFIICAVESRLASAVLATHLSSTAVLQTNKLHHLHYFKKTFLSPPPLRWSGLTNFRQTWHNICVVHTWLFVSFSICYNASKCLQLRLITYSFILMY